MLGAALAFCVVGLGSAVATAATPVNGFISGPISSAKGTSFVVKTSQVPKGRAKVSVTGSTVISQQLVAKASDVKKGVCVMATGQRDGKGNVAAVRITLSRPVKGVCNNGFGGRPQSGGQRPPGGAPPTGGPPGGAPPGGGSGRPPALGNFEFAVGAVTAVKGSTITLHSSQRGKAVVTLSSKTQIVEDRRVTPSAIKTGLCAFVRGTSSDKGVTVSAQVVNLSSASGSGCMSGSPARP